MTGHGAALVAAAALLALVACEPPTDQPTPTPTKVQEDDPQWDCRTMGDKQCGPNWTPRGTDKQ